MKVHNIIAVAAILSSACFQISAAENGKDLKGESYFITYDFGDEPCTMMQSYSISLPSGLTEEQSNTVINAVSDLMTIRPGKEGIPFDSESGFKPMNNDQIRKYSQLYKSDNTDMSNWYYTSEVKPFETRMGVIAMQVANSMYAGGAHGGYSIGYVNYNPVTNKVVTLEDYVKTASGKKALKNILYKKAKRELGSTLYADASSFPIATQYRITDAGITLVYQQYEIGPYAIGLPEYTVPFSTLKGLDSQKTIAPKRKTSKKGKATSRKTRR